MIDYENKTIGELEQLANESNDAEAMFYLGGYYYEGQIIKQDLAKAVEWFQKSAEAGDVDAMFNLAQCYRQREETEQDLKRAFEWYKKSAEANNVAAMFNLAVCYSKGEGVEQDLEQAFKWYKKSAEASDATAMFNLAICYYEGEGTEQDLTQAFEWYKKSAEENLTAAMFNLAHCYRMGEGVEQDLKQAFEWYKKSAEEGYTAAMFNLAQCYRTGRGIEQDLKQAFEWYKKSAEEDHTAAMFNLAHCYRMGEGVKQDLKQAFEWYKKSAEAGDSDAMFNLAFCYNYGEGVEQDLKQAFNCYKKLVEAGHINAIFNLGLCYWSGKGCSPNFKKAAQFLLLAGKKGDETALLILIKESDFRKDKLYPEAFNLYLEKYYPIYAEFSGLVDNKIAKLYRSFLQTIVETENKHLLNVNENNVLYHYTSQKVLNILLNKFEMAKSDDTKAKLRLSMATYLNDPTEGRYIFDRAFEANSDIGDFVDNVRNVFEPYMQDEECVVCDIRPQVYSLSFSTDSDCLDLWRAYGRDEQGRANGVNIAIPTETLEQFNAAISTGMGVKKFIHATSYEDSETQHEIPFLLYKVEYGKDKVIEMWQALQPSLTKLLKAVNNIKDKELTKKLYALIYDAMARLMYLYKHDAYQSEKEVRALHIGTLLDAKYDAIISRVYFETPALLFQHKNTEITLGPQMQPDERSVLLWALRKRMIDLKLADKVTIKSSKVPFR